MRWVAVVFAPVLVVAAVTPAAADDDETKEPARAQVLQRDLKIATAASLIVTGALGGIVSVNRTNSLHTGRCESGDPLFGSYGCGSLSTIHGISAVTSLALYASTTTLEIGIPGVPAPEKLASHPRLHRALTYFHRAAMLVQPLLGITARFPDVIGIDSARGQKDYSETVRTIHAGLGIATIAAYLGTLAIEW